MENKINITWAVTVKDELKELTTLLNFLQLHVREDDQILVQYDTQGVTPEVTEYLELMDTIHENHTIIGFPLNKDFASFKNNLKSHSNGSYIVQCDADEMLSEFFMENIHDVLEKNPVDLVFVPRINTVNGLTEQHVKQWGWDISKLESQIGEMEIDTESEEYKYLKKLGYIIEEVNSKIKYYKPIINFCDYQTRIYKNTPEITWMGKVHEKITGYNNFSNFPAQDEWCIIHDKTIEKQETQNAFYETI